MGRAWSGEPEGCVRAAIIISSEAGPFRIFLEFTASAERIANSCEFHSLKSESSGPNATGVQISACRWFSADENFGVREPSFGVSRKSCKMKKEEFQMNLRITHKMITAL